VERELEILSHGEKVPLNGFAKKIVLNTLLALVGSLHETDTDAEVRIVIGPSSARAPR
jgi:hypothetical protein